MSVAVQADDSHSVSRIFMDKLMSFGGGELVSQLIWGESIINPFMYRIQLFSLF